MIHKNLIVLLEICLKTKSAFLICSKIIRMATRVILIAADALGFSSLEMIRRVA